MIENRYNSTHDSGHEADETLRLLAELPPPDELTERVHRRLAIEENAQVMPERRGFWSLWMPAQRLQFAVAALLVVAVAGSTWSMYHLRPGPVTQTGTRPGTRTGAQPGPAPVVAAPDVNGGRTGNQGGGFDGAKAERVPPTLNPIKVPPAPKKKPGAGHAKASAKTPAAQPAEVGTVGKPAAN
jgi:hypothetical protein